MIPAFVIDEIDGFGNLPIEMWHPVAGLLTCGAIILFLKKMFPIPKVAKGVAVQLPPPTWYHPIFVLHNMAMALFSLVTFIVTLHKFAPKFMSWNAIYDPECKTLMEDPTIYGLGMIFYYSKYYEFVDVWMLIFKRKKLEFLQLFHHFGAVLAMFGLMYTKCEATWQFVLLNSFVHTIMYYYYTLTCFNIRPWWKKYITRTQLIQFCVGLPSTIPYFFLPACSTESTIALSFNNVYVAFLVYLFAQFYRRSYAKKGNAKKVDGN